MILGLDKTVVFRSGVVFEVGSSWHARGQSPSSSSCLVRPVTSRLSKSAVRRHRLEMHLNCCISVFNACKIPNSKQQLCSISTIMIDFYRLEQKSTKFGQNIGGWGWKRSGAESPTGNPSPAPIAIAPHARHDRSMARNFWRLGRSEAYFPSFQY